MDRIKIGDRFRPLENSPEYGPKYWKRDSQGVWVEQGMSKGEVDFERLESTLLWASPSFPFHRTPPITEADAENFPYCKSYVDGFALFPSVRGYPVGSPKQRKLESEWELRSRLMHDAQMPITIEPKPQENILAKVALQRGD